MVLTTPAVAEPSVAILDLPFRARALRGPGSEVAVAVATSGLLPLARPRGADPARDEPDAPIAVAWGDGGGAALSLADGRVTTTLLGAEAVEGLAAAETPRGALPGSRRAVSGPVSAYLADPVPALSGGPEQAAHLVVRERQPVAMGRPEAGAGRHHHPGAGSRRRLRAPPPPPRPARGQARPPRRHRRADGGSALALFAKGDAGWSPLARGAEQAAAPGGQPLKPAAIADFFATGQPQIAAVSAPEAAGLLQV